MRRLFLILLLCCACSWTAEAKKDSAAMARKAQKKVEKEERKRQAELERMATPHFQGGDIDTFERWIVANLRKDFGPLPPDAPFIVVEVPFYVEADGSTTLVDEEIPDSRLYPRVVQEIERVILFSPEWDPGVDPFGNPLRSRQTASITLKPDHTSGVPVVHPTPRPKPKPKPQPKPHPRPGKRRR